MAEPKELVISAGVGRVAAEREKMSGEVVLCVSELSVQMPVMSIVRNASEVSEKRIVMIFE